MYVVDVNVTFSRNPNPQVEFTEDNNLIICECSPEQGESVANIAASCFKYSRFHLDPLISEDLANKIKYEWVLNYAKQKRGDKLFAAYVENSLAGFLAALTYEEANKKIAVIDLVGVSKYFQKRGVGKRLVGEFIKEYGHYDELRVGTQIANVPSINLYVKTGFSLIGSQYVMHMLVKNENK